MCVCGANVCVQTCVWCVAYYKFTSFINSGSASQFSLDI